MKKLLSLILILWSFAINAQFNEQAIWLQQNKPTVYQEIVNISVTDSMVNAQCMWYFTCISDRYNHITQYYYVKYARECYNPTLDGIDYYLLAIKLESHEKNN